jgi:O-acetylhomoserine/O-acetylserine sulfhydrylase-like pyridoxal-dependent enzyme
MATDSKRFETLVLHGGPYRSDPATGAVAAPIYQTTSYQFQDTGHASRLFALEEIGNIYTRVQNPTQDILEQRIAALEGGAAALAVASGQTASAYSVLNLAQAGDNIVSSTDLSRRQYRRCALARHSSGFHHPSATDARRAIGGRRHARLRAPVGRARTSRRHSRRPRASAR